MRTGESEDGQNDTDRIELVPQQLGRADLAFGGISRLRPSVPSVLGST